MRLLPESNSLHKVNMKEKMSKVALFKRIFKVILIVAITGFVIQWGYNFYVSEKFSSRMAYTRVNEKKMEYNVNGSGEYTVIFDGDIGGNSYEWKDIASEVSKDLGVKTFVYNRRGYGFNDGGSGLSPKDQAMDLKILLRKAAASGPYILVGEGYGSLVMTNFAKLYPDTVKGVVLINPYDEDELKNSKNSIKSTLDLGRKKVEDIGSKFSLTLLLDKLGLVTDYEDFSNNITDFAKEEFDYKKDQSPYREAVYNETKNIYDRNSTSQESGMFKDVPYYIISDKSDNSIKRLGSSDLTFELKSDYTGNFYSLMDSENIENGIKKVVDTAKKIQRQENKN